MRRTSSGFFKSSSLVSFTYSFLNETIFQIEICRINTEIAVEILQLKLDQDSASIHPDNTKNLALLIEKAAKKEP